MDIQTTIERPTICYATATAVVAAGVSAAVERGVLATIVVSDVAGEPVAVGRCDGAAMLSLHVASDKAWTAANAGRSTADVHAFVNSDPGAVLSMPSVPRFTVVAGGFPLLSGDKVVGAIGVSGGSSAQDVAVALDALAAVGKL